MTFLNSTGSAFHKYFDEHYYCYIETYAHVILGQKSTDLFTACCKHGFVPNNFCGWRISSVPKNGSLSQKSADYRPVTAINVIAKVFECYLLRKLSGLAMLDDLQLGFTKNGGCDNAVYITICLLLNISLNMTVVHIFQH